MSVQKRTIYYSCKRNIDYFEYKYHIPHNQLSLVLAILDSWCCQSDIYPQGWVDSIYYDNYNAELLQQCSEGYNHKIKFRIRGYDNHYLQLQQKTKDIYGVTKYKSNIKPKLINDSFYPPWEELFPSKENDPEFQKITYHARRFGPIMPVIRVKYFRYRYRLYDYRITVDTDIEFYSPNYGLTKNNKHAILPFHVLEIKTRQLRPSLPFIGVISLAPISCSKFMLGLDLLT